MNKKRAKALFLVRLASCALCFVLLLCAFLLRRLAGVLRRLAGVLRRLAGVLRRLAGACVAAKNRRGMARQECVPIPRFSRFFGRRMDERGM